MASGSSLPLEQAKTPRSGMDIAQATPAAGRRILFLDDDPDRARSFLGRHPEAVWVETAGECIVRLAERWNEVHLDHDLGGEIYVDSSRQDCGMEVVRWLCSQPNEPSATLFFVHSHNADAASAMVQCLRQHGYEAVYRPFGIDVLAWLVTESEELPDLPPPQPTPHAPDLPPATDQPGWLARQLLRLRRVKPLSSTDRVDLPGNKPSSESGNLGSE